MKLKTIKKNIAKKNFIAEKILLSAILAGSFAINTSVTFAEEGDEELDNKYALNTAEVNSDTVTFNGATQTVEGDSYSVTADGSVGSKNIAYNNLTINGRNFIFNLLGGSWSGNFNGNNITLNGGSLNLNFSDAVSYTGNVTNNTLSINGGTFSNSYNSISAGSASGNTFNISGSPDISNAYIYGGLLGDFANASGNTLTVGGIGLTAKNIYDFDTLNFNLPSSTSNGGTVLTLTDGATDISNASVNAVIAGGTTLTTGNTVNLISNSNGVNSSGASFGSKFAEGVTVTYDSEITATDNGLVLTIGNPHVEEQTKALNQGVLDSSKVVARGTERIIDWLPPEEFDDAMADGNISAIVNSMAAAVNSSFGTFANMNGGKIKTKTGAGSYIESKNTGMDLGFARAVENQRGGTWIFAPMFDYGHSDYNSYLADGTHGSGTSKYISGGIIGRRMLNNGFYVEGSFRGGKAETDFTSSDFTRGTQRVNVSYKADSPVFAGHIRIGKLMRLTKNNLLHAYGIYAHNHINSMDTDLSTGEHYNFDSVDSGKFQLGYRLTTRVSKISKLYTGIAYQYEFNGKTSGKYRTFTTPEAEVKGSSAMIELGWQIKADGRSNWIVDINTTGWMGLQKGLNFTAKVKKDF